MHAKLTRDRKKLFTSRLQQMIQTLERQNSLTKNRIMSILQQQNYQGSSENTASLCHIVDRSQP
jgi:hypothetical protein